MTRDEYELIQTQVILFGNVIEDVDARGAIEMINRAETVGMFGIAPVAYTAALPRLRAYKDCLQAVTAFQEAFSRFRAVVGETELTAASVRHLLPEGNE